jgi:hypothetical protein
VAKIVMGLASSHTPMLTLSASEWLIRARADHDNPKLNLSDGRTLSYDQLLAEVEPRSIELEALERQATACQAALDRLADELEEAKPDVVIIIGDDQQELFDAANQPAIAIYWGDLVRTHSEYEDEALPDWVKRVGAGYMMDAVHDLPGAPELGFELITGLIDRCIDVGSCASVKDPTVAGFGHAFGFIAKRLMRGKPIPVLPILLNTYYAPNVPTARRCHDIGKALADAIAEANSVARVAIVASGGLSHFVVDEGLDRKVLDGLKPGGADVLRSIERGALNSGSSEILNWVVLSAAVGDMPLTWSEYHPIYRTPAGTGVGVCFAAWNRTGMDENAGGDKI